MRRLEGGCFLTSQSVFYGRVIEIVNSLRVNHDAEGILIRISVASETLGFVTMQGKYKAALPVLS